MEKIKFEIEQASNGIKIINDLCYVGDGVTRGSFIIKINDVKIDGSYSCPVCSSNKKVIKKELIADIVTYYIIYQEELKSLTLTKQEKALINDYEYEKDFNLGKISTMIEKYFDVSFISDYIIK